MTGYAKLQRTYDNWRITCEVKSLNSKYLTVEMSLPQFLFPFEHELVQVVQSHVKRGKVSAKVTVEFLTPPDAVKVDLALAKSYYDALEQLVLSLGIPEPVKLEDLLKFKDIVRFELPQDQQEAVARDVKQLLDETLIALNKERETEGNKLAKDLIEITQSLTQNIAEIKERFERIKPLVKEKLVENVKSLLSETVPVSEVLIENAVALYVQKVDIREELTRLSSHVERARQLLMSQEPAGNHLDFLAQEMNREITTVLAKTQDSDIVNVALNCKVLISQFREQVQNLE